VQRAVASWRERLGEQVPVIATSSATGAGLRELSGELLRRVEPAPPGEGVLSGAGAAGRRADLDPRREGGIGGDGASAPGAAAGEQEQLAEHMVFRPAARSGFRVERLGPGSFAVRGDGIERLLARYDVDNEDAMAHFESRLRRIGVLKELEAHGFQAGDEIEIAGEVFELDPQAPS
jgi:GTPase